MNQAIVATKGEYFGKVVCARDIQNGLIPYKGLYFVDPEYQFRVIFKHRGKNGRSEHFALYLSKEDWNRLEKQYDEETRRIILSRLRHEDESQWHKHWKEVFGFAELEKFIKNIETRRYRRPDVYLAEQKTCLEFQHSFSDKTFLERSQFFDDLGLNVIWLFDLTGIDVIPKGDNAYVIPEDNLKGFFNVAFYPENMSNYAILFQARDKKIYLIDALEHLGKYEIPHNGLVAELNSSVRLIHPLCIYSEDSFVKAVVSGDNELRSLAYLEATSKYDSVIYARKTAKLRQIKEMEARKEAEQQRKVQLEQERIAREKAEKEKQNQLQNSIDRKIEIEVERQQRLDQFIHKPENKQTQYDTPSPSIIKSKPVIIKRDSIYTCKYCGRKGPESEFVSFGGSDGQFVGVCRNSECREKNYNEIKLRNDGMKAKPTDQDPAPVCPRCGAKMIRRNGRFGSFWGCSNYPDCRYTLKI